MSAQFKVIPQAAGGVMISVNQACLKLLVSALSVAPEGETVRARKARTAMLRELEQPTSAPIGAVVVSTHRQRK